MNENVLVFEDGIERKATPEEILEISKIKDESKATKDLVEAKAEARTSALAKLAALGLTEEEIAAL
jgi:hypothetical protein